MTDGVEAWLSGRLKRVPAELHQRLALDEAGSSPSGGGRGGTDLDVAGELACRGLAFLTEAAARPGRNRRAAFDLLAADAYITYACEAALEGPDPERRLRSLIARIASEAE